MKVQIVATKKVPGAKRVEWPEVPEWVWERAGMVRNSYVQQILHGNSCSVSVTTSLGIEKSITYRVQSAITREVIAENVTDGPWLIQEPDREVPMTVEEVQAKFPESEWLLMGIGGHDFWGIDFRALNISCDWWTAPATIIVLNRHTFETVNIAEVTE